MDPVTQGLVGAAFAQTRAKKTTLIKAGIIGALGGMAPDLDVFIRSSTDPILALEYHRHFTHSFAFIPFGGLLCAVVFFPLFTRRWHLSFKQTYLWATMGYATHALLDVCTSYGTQVLWPFSNFRLSIDIVSVIDPLFTLPLLFALIAACWQRSYVLLYSGITWCALYLCFGAWQHTRAIEAGAEIAKARGHQPVRLDAKPSFANLVVWKTLYEFNGRYYVDAVRPGLAKFRYWPGQSVEKLNIERDLPWLDAKSQQARDLERFRWFSDDFIALATDPLPSQSQSQISKVVDMRYSLLPNKINALWGIQLSRDKLAHEHVEYSSSHERAKSSTRILLNMIFHAEESLTLDTAPQ